MLLLCAGVAAAQQTVPAPAQSTALVGSGSSGKPGAISGLVIDRTTNAPLGGVVVSITPPPSTATGDADAQVTDEKGRFIFGPLKAPQRYGIRVSKPGYIEDRAGRRRGGISDSVFPSIVLPEGQWVRDVRIVMTRPAAISGSVVDDRGQPIVGAIVRVLTKIPIAGQLQLATGRETRTDDRGAYRLAPLGAGSYVVQMPSVQNSIPAAATLNQLLGLADGAGPELNRGSIGFTTSVVDLGADVRIAVSSYPLAPRSADGRWMIYPSTFFPSALAIVDASAVTVGDGDERSGIDLHVAPMTGGTITGRIDGPPESYTGLSLRLLPTGSEDLGPGGETATALIGSSGRFVFVNVPAGSYTIDARRTVSEYSAAGGTGARSGEIPPPPGQLLPSRGSGGYTVSNGADGAFVSMRVSGTPIYWGRERVTADGRSATDVTVHMMRGATISGRLVFEGTGRSSPRGDAVISAEPAHGSASLGVTRSRPDPASPDGFVITGLLPGEYVIAASITLTTLGSVRLKSIVCGGQDHTYVPIDVTSGGDVNDCVVIFTDKATLLTGTAHDRQGHPTGEATVIIFPAEREQWTPLGLGPTRFKGLRVDSDGSFRIDTLPAGEYLSIAVTPDQGAGWLEPGFLEKVAPQATRLRLEWGGTTTQNVTLVTVK